MPCKFPVPDNPPTDRLNIAAPNAPALQENRKAGPFRMSFRALWCGGPTGSPERSRSSSPRVSARSSPHPASCPYRVGRPGRPAPPGTTAALRPGTFLHFQLRCCAADAPAVSAAAIEPLRSTPPEVRRCRCRAGRSGKRPHKVFQEVIHREGSDRPTLGILPALRGSPTESCDSRAASNGGPVCEVAAANRAGRADRGAPPAPRRRCSGGGRRRRGATVTAGNPAAVPGPSPRGASSPRPPIGRISESRAGLSSGASRRKGRP